MFVLLSLVSVVAAQYYLAGKVFIPLLGVNWLLFLLHAPQSAALRFCGVWDILLEWSPCGSVCCLG